MSVVGDRALEVAGQLNAAHLALVEFVAAVLADESWGVDGIRSPEQWLGWQLGLSHSEACRAVTIARCLESHPVLCGMFRAGRLSIAQTAIAVTVDPSRDAELADVAVACTLYQLQLFARAMRTADEPPPAEQPDRVESLRFHVGGDGWLHGRFDLDAEHSQIFASALEQCRDTLVHHHDDASVDKQVAGPVRWVDALLEMAERSLDAETSAGRRDRYRINVYLDLERDWSASWIDHRRVPGWLARHLSCDGRITPTFTRHGTAVSVGRSARVVPERTRRAVLFRDGKQCRIPWCNRTIGLDVHHVVHWVDGGPTDTANLIAACRLCHRAIHHGHLTLHGDADQPDGLVFGDRYARVIDPHPIPPQPQRPPPPTAATYEHPYGERLHHDDIWISPSRTCCTG